MSYIHPRMFDLKIAVIELRLGTVVVC